MGKNCVLTDSTCVFPHAISNFAKNIRIVELTIEEFRPPIGIEKSAYVPHLQKLKPPSNQALSNLILEVCDEFDHVLVLTSSATLSPMHGIFSSLIQSSSCHHKFEILDTCTTNLGLGILVAKAATELSSGVPVAEVVDLTRKRIPHIYTILCAANLNQLFANNLADPGQALISEFYSLAGVFSIEDGELSPIAKTKNITQTMEAMVNFTAEFENAEKIYLAHDRLQNTELKYLLERFAVNNPKTAVVEVPLPPIMRAQWGKRAISLTVQDSFTTR